MSSAEAGTQAAKRKPAGAAVDETDRRILRLLQQDARMRNVHIARRLGLSATWVQQRILRLRRNGLIEGFTAVVDASKLGPSVIAFAKVRIDPEDVRGLRGFRAAMQSCDSVLECHALQEDEWHYLLKIRVTDIGACRRLLLQSGLESLGVCRVRTVMVVEEVKRRSVPFF